MGRKLPARRAEVIKKQIHAAQLAVMEAISEAGPEAVASLRKLAVEAEDERAKYSAAAKIVDLLMPRAQSPLVQINMGAELKSHLALPPAPEASPIDVTAAVKGRSALEIVKEEVAKRATITPEARAHAAFMRQRFGIEEPLTPPEPAVLEFPKGNPAQEIKLKEVESIPSPSPYPDSR